MKTIVQISLDITNIPEALETARMAVRAGVDWLEAGTTLILGEGLHAVRALHERFPDHPVIADLKTMDAGYLEAEMMFRAGATFVVVMAVAHEQEMVAKQAENRAEVVLAEAEIPKAMAEAFRNGSFGVMDYYKLKNVQADTNMRESIAGNTK